MGFEKAGYDFTPAKFIDDGEDALFIEFQDTGKTVKYVPERTCKNLRKSVWNFKCSNCETAFDTTHVYFDIEFCPNCGAKVVGD